MTESRAWRYWIRLNVICGWPFLLLLDCCAALTGDKPWRELRDWSNKELRKIWNRE